MRAIVFSLLVASTVFAQPKPACDRACLEGWIDRYLDAMLAHDASKVSFAKDYKFTENGQRLIPPDGLWNTITAKGTYRTFVTDVEAQSVAFFGSIQEMNTGAMLGLRLKIRNNQITEAEQFIQRSPSSATGFEKIGYKWTEPIPAGERVSREQLIEVANKYFTGMASNDGKGDYPFADDCHRIENGGNSTNTPTPPGQTRPDPKTSTGYSSQWGCKEQFASGLLHFVTRIRDRRYVAVDPERGLVYAFGFFDHSAGDTRDFAVPDGRKVSAGPQQPWTWQIVELFRLEKGKIRQIEAIMERSPYGMNAGWSAWEDGLSSRARDVAK
ncbi:MAG: hypothetical protein ABIR70_17340 [Bryobacteraceae bacterium]